jgi:acyl-CoA reductase-like NAD-dependent aldehyde dehydrogenase
MARTTTRPFRPRRNRAERRVSSAGTTPLFRRQPSANRDRILLKFADVVEAHAEELAAAISVHWRARLPALGTASRLFQC